MREEGKIKKEELEELNRILKEADKINLGMAPEQQDIFNAFQAAKANLPSNKGFNRIGGYDKLIRLVKSQFIDGMIGFEKRFSANLNVVPNVVLFFGPTGVGKSTISQAVAEQTISNLEIIKVGKQSPATVIKRLHEIGQESKRAYENSGRDKKRTMVILDETNEMQFSWTPEHFRQLNEFLQDCSSKHKCTVFLTTNHPLDLEPELLSEDITPLKIPVPPPTKDDIKAILEKYFTLHRRPIFNFENVAQRFSSPQNGSYSNTDLVKICDAIFAVNTHVNEQTFIDLLDRRNIEKYNTTTLDELLRPKVTRTDIQDFEEARRQLNV